MTRWQYLLSTIFLSVLWLHPAYSAEEPVLNVYVWSGVIPEFTIRQFEQETGIKVNFSTYDSNEVMYAKLRADKNPNYDVIEPSSYYIDRMRKQDMLEKLDKSALSNLSNMNPRFMRQTYDPGSAYGIPFIWGVTGIFVNRDYFDDQPIDSWSTLWDTRFKNQLLLFDDSREVFSIALRVLGYSANDTNPAHVHEAYLKLKEILPNVKMFNSAVLSLLIDEDATIGMAWNGDWFKAKQENPNLRFVFPKDGFIIWVDNFAIPKNAPHKANALRFLNFLMRADVAKAMTLDTHFSTANLAAQKLLPLSIQHNATIYPSDAVLQHGEYQTDIGEKALALYEAYWERLKMEG